jgi:hypothetical protein
MNHQSMSALYIISIVHIWTVTDRLRQQTLSGSIVKRVIEYKPVNSAHVPGTHRTPAAVTNDGGLG